MDHLVDTANAEAAGDANTHGNACDFTNGELRVCADVKSTEEDGGDIYNATRAFVSCAIFP